MIIITLVLLWITHCIGEESQHILPYQVQCCKTYNKLSCIMNSKCTWSLLASTCDYKEEVSPFEMDLCSNKTDTDSCSFELDDDLSTIPTFNVRPELLQHSIDEFPSPPEIIKVTNGVYIATGYDLANTIIIETQTGMIIVDTLSEGTVARKVFNDYKLLRINERNEDQMLIEAIILTHYHTDHSMGIGFWLNLNIENEFEIIPTIYANEEILDGLQRLFLYSLFSIATRAQRQFGALMYHDMDPSIVDKKKLFINSGIGPHLNKENNATFFDLKDDNVILITEQEYKLTVSNIELILIHSPGETSDQTSIWYSNEQVLFVGDNFYYSFPNLYSIRGTTPRDPKKWIKSLEKYLNYNVEYLIGSHTLPIYGWNNIQNELILYRDLIAFIHDQTVRYMNQQWKIQDIVKKIEETLPAILRQGRKQEFYGTVEWSVRSIYDMYLGWFKGDSSELYPSNANDRGEGLYQILKILYNDNSDGDMIETLVSYLEEILDFAEENKDDSKYIQVALKEERWALEIVTSLSTFYGKYKQCDEWETLKELRWRILENMAGRSISANGRNYLITQYLEERYNLAAEDVAISDSDIILTLPIEWILDGLRGRVRPELIFSDTNEWNTNLKFIDSGLMFQLTLRNGGVLSIKEYSKFDQVVIDQYDEMAQLIYTMNEIDFKKQQVFDLRHIIKGTILDAGVFWGRFQPQTSVNIEGESTVEEEEEMISVNDYIYFHDEETTSWSLETININGNLFDFNDILGAILFDKRDFVFVIVLSILFSVIGSFLNSKVLEYEGKGK